MTTKPDPMPSFITSEVMPPAAWPIAVSYLETARERCRKSPVPDFTQEEILDILNEIEWRGERIIQLKDQVRRSGEFNERQQAEYHRQLAMTNERHLAHERERTIELTRVHRELDDARKSAIHLLRILAKCSATRRYPSNADMDELIYGAAGLYAITSYPALSPSPVERVWTNQFEKAPWTADRKSSPKAPPKPSPSVDAPTCSRCQGSGTIQCSCQRVPQGLRGHVAHSIVIDEVKEGLLAAGWTKRTSDEDSQQSECDPDLTLLDPDVFEDALHQGRVEPLRLPAQIASTHLLAAVLYANHMRDKLRECIQCVRSNFGDYDAALCDYLNDYELDVLGEVRYSRDGRDDESLKDIVIEGIKVEPTAPCEPLPHPWPPPLSCTACLGTGYIHDPTTDNPRILCPACCPF